jgi:DNA repair exonuclease SbcCD ATPase subunit
MIKFKTLTIKNFLSVGACTQSINFEKNDLTLILGENLDLGGNGSRNACGKTVMINALSYALYGQAITSIKRDFLINLTNGKGMLVSLDFEIDSKNYRIERGRKPNVLKFFVNDKQQEFQDDNAQGDSRQTQDAIEHLIGMTHEMFRHIVALNTFTEPFLSMKASDQRLIIEQLLGVTALSDKANQVKNHIRQTKDLHTEEDFRIKAIQEANKRVQEQIDSLITKRKVWNKKKKEDLDTLTENIEKMSHVNIETEIKNHALLQQYNEKKSQITDISVRIDNIEELLGKERKFLKKINTEIETLLGNKCYACGQDFHDENHKSVLEQKIESKQEHENNVSVYLKELENLNLELKKLGDLGGEPVVFYSEIADAYNHKNMLQILERDLVNKTNEENPYESQVAEMQANAIQEVSFDTLNNINKLLEHQEFLLKLLTNKDSFIRKKIIEQNLSYLNSRLSHYLDKLGLPHGVQFQNDLSVEINDLGRPIDFHNLSRGERGRLIVSLSFAFRDVWESMFSKINLLFVDELLDNGFDTNGVESAMAMLKKFGRDDKKSVWLISHRDEFSSRVKSIMRVYKENGFTTYELESQ